jgi:DNA-binding protein H-NS
MALTYLEIQAQIVKLQAEAERLRDAERLQVIEKIRVAVAAFELTTNDLFGGRRPSSKAASAAGSKSASMSGKKKADGAARNKPFAPTNRRHAPRTVAIKYRDGPNVWSGRGSKPKWLTAAIAAGKTIEQFRL